MAMLEMLVPLGHLVTTEKRSVFNQNKDLSLPLNILVDKILTKSLAVLGHSCYLLTHALRGIRPQ